MCRTAPVNMVFVATIRPMETTARNTLNTPDDMCAVMAFSAGPPPPQAGFFSGGGGGGGGEDKQPPPAGGEKVGPDQGGGGGPARVEGLLAEGPAVLEGVQHPQGVEHARAE